ncbi:uncharacterized protein LOC116851595 [Odontomachus brunneus]|uniref:uncharacterized protein LOC116851595 n=1 Tax=Odontomachus brunneus TaxID=486640 RepID=UPI0013F1A7D7|nr:uncharacterized protein LOC116851595 [Odontomachus brunneus]
MDIMSNDKYIVCGFPNENNKISIAYKEWIISQLDDDGLQGIIDQGTQIQLKWPKNCVIKMHFATMDKVLKKADWEVTVQLFWHMVVSEYFLFCYFNVRTVIIIVVYTTILCNKCYV